ncbi:MAG: hypothetical protein ACOY0T_14900 [Myxococcota bacterium]
MNGRLLLLAVAVVGSSFFAQSCGGSSASHSDTSKGGQTGMGGLAGQGGQSQGLGGQGQGGSVRTTGPRSEPLPRPACPPDKPTQGSACSAELTCSYGATSNWHCRSIFVCDGTVWDERQVECDTQAQSACPTSPPSSGDACSPQGTTKNLLDLCGYADGNVCACYVCTDRSPTFPACSSSGPRWSCAKPPVDLDCPLLPPNAGEGCAINGKECVYGPEGCGSRVTTFCHVGTWEHVEKACSL